MDSLKKVKIPIPPIADQQRIVRALDKFDEFVKALPREIELRQKQYEHYRDLLLSFPKSHSDGAA
jgi:type I restriction enzyme, S subunit